MTRGGILGSWLLGTLLSGCGDDGKVGGPPAPEGDPSPAPPRRTAATPAVPADVRAGDVATWEVRVAGLPQVTTVTWRATRGEAGRVETTVESRTSERSGRLLAEASAPAPFAAGPLARADVVEETAEEVDVGGRALSALRRTLRLPSGDATVWWSAEVPFGGIVRARTPGGVEQDLVSWRRGPPAGR
jgi:hypothetical protein